MSADVRHRRACTAALASCLLALLTFAPGEALAKDPPRGARAVERYPPSFRLAVQTSIEKGVASLKRMQAPGGTWGKPQGEQALGHTALPLLALLKAGVPREDPSVQRAFAAARSMPIRMVYSVAVYMMAIHASYEPALDTRDTDVGASRQDRARPKEVRRRLAAEDLAALEAGRDYLLEVRRPNGLWHYDRPEGEAQRKHDLSNSQYALLGLRAAMDCGLKVPSKTWHRALDGLLRHQDEDGPSVRLLEHRVRGTYAFESRSKARARGFHYTLHKRRDGGAGWHYPATGSMTTAGVACVALCAEGLVRARKLKAADRRAAANSIRDGLAWMQEHFAVDTNPGYESRRHHLYYLYGLERMGMLLGRRWIGSHDWYRKGADLLLASQQESGAWGRHADTAFGVLFLKRATRATDTVVTTN